MVEYIIIDKTSYLDYKKELINLYVESFSTGISAQYLEENETEKYFDHMMCCGFVVAGTETSSLISCLACVPVSFDTIFPPEFNDIYSDYNSCYISEVLVSENYRSKGIAKSMLEELEKKMPKNIKYILLRVWKENIPALNLYKKKGYVEFTEILHEKIKTNGIETFIMEKVYMVKTLY